MNMHIKPDSGAASPCLFSVGTYARTLDGIVYILDGSSDGYQVVRIEREEECFYRADELSTWSPLAGECVVEADNEDCITGVVLHVRDGTSLVKWPGFVRPQAWANADLEPAWDQGNETRLTATISP